MSCELHPPKFHTYLRQFRSLVHLKWLRTEKDMTKMILLRYFVVIWMTLIVLLITFATKCWVWLETIQYIAITHKHMSYVNFIHLTSLRSCNYILNIMNYRSWYVQCTFAWGITQSNLDEISQKLDQTTRNYSAQLTSWRLQCLSNSYRDQYSLYQYDKFHNKNPVLTSLFQSINWKRPV